MILTIAAKDIRSSWVHFLVAGILGLIGGFITSSIAASSGLMCYYYRFEWDWSIVAYVYGFAALGTSLSVGLAFAQFYGEELKRGTVRALILYPIDLNDLTIAKLLSATVVGSATGALAFLVPMAPFMAGCILPGGGGLLIFVGALATTLFIVWTGAFLAHVLASLTHRLSLTPSAMAGILLLLAALLSQQSLNLFGILLANITSGGRGVDYATIQGIWSVAGGIAVLSPHHATATVLSSVLSPDLHFPDVFVVLPVGALILAYGYVVGRRIPLDVFIK
jgi:hypothetical protein